MVINEVTLELRRTGEQATFVCQGRPMGVAVRITLPELERFALYLAHEVGLWRDKELSKAEDVRTQAEPPMPVSMPAP